VKKMKYRINKEKCLGINQCGICLRNCPGATQEGNDGKAEIIDQERLDICGGLSVCPVGAIEEVDQEATQIEEVEKRTRTQFIPGQGRGLGMGGGRGIGAGRGRGLGMGPRDGRGGGRGGGGRRG
jgi:NAD-dependent dihydropyrimidine dehydrogenase PreA subunit